MSSSGIQKISVSQPKTAELSKQKMAWTDVGLTDTEIWQLRRGSVPPRVTCKTPGTGYCVLDSLQLADISSGKEHDLPVSKEWSDATGILGDKGYSTIPETQVERDVSDSQPVCVVSLVMPLGCNPVSLPPMVTSTVVTPREQKPGTACPSEESHSPSKNIPLPSTKSANLPKPKPLELTLLKVSQPALLGGHPGHYVVKLVRTSLNQLFCLGLMAATTRDGRISAMFVSDDFPYFGISRWDRLLSINGVQPRSVEDCHIMVKNLLSLVLVLQFRSAQSVRPVPKPMMEFLPPADQWLLTIKQEMSENGSDFLLTIKRRSSKLKLDLPFGALPNSTDLGPWFVTCDKPHLQVFAGDQFISVNGCSSLCWMDLCQILDTALTLEVTLRRDSRLGRPLPLEQLAVEASEDDRSLML